MDNSTSESKNTSLNAISVIVLAADCFFLACLLYILIWESFSLPGRFFDVIINLMLLLSYASAFLVAPIIIIWDIVMIILSIYAAKKSETKQTKKEKTVTAFAIILSFAPVLFSDTMFHMAF